MNLSKINKAHFKNLHLIISASFIIPIAMVYGLCPNTSLATLFHLQVNTVNLKNVFRALMGLYLAMSSMWILGASNARYWFAATLLNVVFMTGLAFGRIFSLALDGLPATYFLVGLWVEATLAFWGFYNLKKYRSGERNRAGTESR